MKQTFHIQNLKCSGCETTIRNRLMKIPGIDSLSIHLDESAISLSYVNEDVLRTVLDTLAQIGYPLAGETNNLASKATSYISCAIGKLNH